MESGRSNGSSIRGSSGGKKMRKRKELDALVGGVGVKRVGGGNKRPGSGGVSPQDQLLSESTGDDDYWSTVKPGGKIKRHYSSSNGKRSTNTCSALLRLCTILLIMACVVATITVMWLFIDIREQTTYLRSQLDQVAAGSQGVPDEIQKCHSLSRQLQNNQTLIFAQMAVMAQRLSNFSNLIGVVQDGLNNVETQLHKTPELVNMPDQHLQALSSSIARYGSDIQDLRTTATRITEEHKQVQGDLAMLKKNVTTFSGLLSKYKYDANQDPTANSTSLAHEKLVNLIEDKLRQNLTKINDTLVHRISWLKDDQMSNQKEIGNLQETSLNMSTRLTSLRNDYERIAANLTSLSSQLEKVEELSKSNVERQHEQIEATKKLPQEKNEMAEPTKDGIHFVTNTTNN